jgi:sortase (surface protein transpeptidase)
LRNFTSYFIISTLNYFTLILCILIWINFLSPTAKAKKEERLQKEAKDKENRLRIENQKKKKRALEKKKKQDELNEYLSSVRISKPGFILKAQIEFEREYKSTKNLTKIHLKYYPFF